MTTDTTPTWTAANNPEIPEGRTAAPTSTLPPSEVLMSLNGFDEIAIAANFGEKIGALRDDPITCGRALAFVHFRRAGQKDKEAHTAAQTLTMREVVEFFAPEPEDDDAAASAEGNAESA